MLIIILTALRAISLFSHSNIIYILIGSPIAILIYTVFRFHLSFFANKRGRGVDAQNDKLEQLV